MYLLSAYQARLNGFISRISNNNLKIALFNKDKNLVIVLHEDADDHLYKCHANNISTMVKKLYKSYLKCIAKVRHKDMHHSWDPGGKATNPGSIIACRHRIHSW